MATPGEQEAYVKTKSDEAIEDWIRTETRFKNTKNNYFRWHSEERALRIAAGTWKIQEKQEK